MCVKDNSELKDMTAYVIIGRTMMKKNNNQDSDMKWHCGVSTLKHSVIGCPPSCRIYDYSIALQEKLELKKGEIFLCHFNEWGQDSSAPRVVFFVVKPQYSESCINVVNLLFA